MMLFRPLGIVLTGLSLAGLSCPAAAEHGLGHAPLPPHETVAVPAAHAGGFEHPAPNVRREPAGPSFDASHRMDGLPTHFAPHHTRAMGMSHGSVSAGAMPTHPFVRHGALGSGHHTAAHFGMAGASHHSASLGLAHHALGQVGVSHAGAHHARHVGFSAAGVHSSTSVAVAPLGHHFRYGTTGSTGHVVRSVGLIPLARVATAPSAPHRAASAGASLGLVPGGEAAGISSTDIGALGPSWIPAPPVELTYGYFGTYPFSDGFYGTVPAGTSFFNVPSYGWYGTLPGYEGEIIFAYGFESPTYGFFEGEGAAVGGYVATPGASGLQAAGAGAGNGNGPPAELSY